MAKNEQLTITEATALCLVKNLDGETFGATEAKAASKTLAMLLESKQVDSDTFGEVNARIGNHSAIRQWAIKMGLLKAKDAAKDALCKEVERLRGMDKAELDSIV